MRAFWVVLREALRAERKDFWWGLLGFQGVSSIPEGSLEVGKGLQDKASPSAGSGQVSSLFIS